MNQVCVDCSSLRNKRLAEAVLPSSRQPSGLSSGRVIGRSISPQSDRPTHGHFRFHYSTCSGTKITLPWRYWRPIPYDFQMVITWFVRPTVSCSSRMNSNH